MISGRYKDRDEGRKKAADLLTNKVIGAQPMEQEDLQQLADLALKGIIPPPSFGFGVDVNRQAFYTMEARLARNAGTGDIAVARADINAGTMSIGDLTKLQGRLEAFGEFADKIFKYSWIQPKP
jgi:hypothetical protein